MAQKDTSEKILESYNDVFSDIVNVLLFNGKQVLSADELEDQAPRSYYKADGKIREIERDVAKRWKNGNIRVACIGFENQTASDPNMPLRVMGYDGAEYRAQLLGNSENLYPVVTLVLYFGHDRLLHAGWCGREYRSKTDFGTCQPDFQTERFYRGRAQRSAQLQARPQLPDSLRRCEQSLQ